MKRIALFFCLIGSAALISETAIAREGELRGRQGRDGLTFGVGLGGGDLACSSDFCDDFTEAGSFNVFVGGMASPDLAITFDAWWMVHSKDRLTVDQGIMSANVRFWPIDHLWLRGGLGVARASYKYDGVLVDASDHTEWVPAFVVGVGVEPIATENFGLDIKLEYGTGFYSDGDTRLHSIALALGIAFY